METKVIKINGHTVKLSIHYIDDEVSEVYAMLDGMEIEFSYDLEDMMYKLENNDFLKMN